MIRLWMLLSAGMNSNLSPELVSSTQSLQTLEKYRVPLEKEVLILTVTSLLKPVSPTVQSAEIGGWWETYSARNLNCPAFTNSQVSPSSGLKGFQGNFSIVVIWTAWKKAQSAILLIGSFSAQAKSMISANSKGAAPFYRMPKGSLKYTGTEIFESSLPIESFKMVHKLILTLGSLKNGS